MIGKFTYYRKDSFSRRLINEWNKLSLDCVHASCVDMFKNKRGTYLIKAGYTLRQSTHGVLVSQWLPCPLSSRLVAWMSILSNLVKSF